MPAANHANRDRLENGLRGNGLKNDEEIKRILQLLEHARFCKEINCPRKTCLQYVNYHNDLLYNFGTFL